MAEDKSAAKMAAGMSTVAAIAAALAWINIRKAAPPGGELTLPPEFVQLVAAIAATSDSIDANLLKVITELAKLAINVQGWPANTDSLTALRVAIAVTGTQLPSITIPSGMSLVIKAWALNPGWLQVGATLGECTNLNQSFPLLPSEVVAYQVENADEIYIAGNAAGCFACLTVEQRRGGGA